MPAPLWNFSIQAAQFWLSATKNENFFAFSFWSIQFCTTSWRNISYLKMKKQNQSAKKFLFFLFSASRLNDNFIRSTLTPLNHDFEGHSLYGKWSKRVKKISLPHTLIREGILCQSRLCWVDERVSTQWYLWRYKLEFIWVLEIEKGQIIDLAKNVGRFHQDLAFHLQSDSSVINTKACWHSFSPSTKLIAHIGTVNNSN